MKLQLWTMNSDPGYVPSHGSQRAFHALREWREYFQGRQEELITLLLGGNVVEVTEGHLSNVRPIAWRNGVCNYAGVEGDYTPRYNSAVAVLTIENISTESEPFIKVEFLEDEDE